MPGSTADAPALSVVIPVRDRFGELGDCLASLAVQRDAPPFEVIVVDDGSLHPAPATLADDASPSNSCSSASRRRASARRATLIECKRGDRGHVYYLNTSGFALRRSLVPAGGQLFDESVTRGEDTLLLAELLARDITPLLVDGGIVVHHPHLTLPRYLGKHFTIGYQTGRARRTLRPNASAIFTDGQRKGMLGEMWRRGKTRRRGTTAVCLVVVAYAIERTGRLAATMSER